MLSPAILPTYTHYEFVVVSVDREEGETQTPGPVDEAHGEQEHTGVIGSLDKRRKERANECVCCESVWKIWV